MRKKRFLFCVCLTFGALVIAGSLVFAASRGYIPGTNNGQRISPYLTISEVNMKLLEFDGSTATIEVKYTLSDTLSQAAQSVTWDAYRWDPSTSDTYQLFTGGSLPMALGPHTENISFTPLGEHDDFWIVLKATDDHADKYRIHVPKPALESGGQKKLPLAVGHAADDREASLLQYDATLTPMQDGTGYLMYTPTDSTKDDVLKNIEEAEVIYLVGHGTAGGGMIRVDDNTYVHGCRPPSNPHPTCTYINELNLSQAKVVVFDGCYTALTDTATGFGNLCQEAVDVGADAALGFADSIRLAGDDFWAYHFWGAMAEWCEPPYLHHLTSAAIHAAEAWHETYGPYHPDKPWGGYNTWKIEGGEFTQILPSF